jgi:hypothetical protein
MHVLCHYAIPVNLTVFRNCCAVLINRESFEWFLSNFILEILFYAIYDKMLKVSIYELKPTSNNKATSPE